MPMLDEQITLKLSTAVIVDSIKISNWLLANVGTQGSRWDIKMDLEGDKLTWSFASPEDRLLFALSWVDDLKSGRIYD